MSIDFQQLELFERWLPVPDWEGFYEVSDWGRVRSVARKVDYGVRGHATYAGRLLAQAKKPNGYLWVGLKRAGKTQRVYVHRLVALAFLGPCPIGKEVDHIDGDRTHNTVENFQYVTRSENMRKAGALGNRWAAKLIEDQLIEVRRLRLEGMTQAAIAKIFKVSASTISNVLSGRYYSQHQRGE